MEELAGLWRGERCPAQRPRSSPELAPATGEGSWSRTSGILLSRRQVRCWCCLATAPGVAAESKTMSGIAGVNAEVLPDVLAAFTSLSLGIPLLTRSRSARPIPALVRARCHLAVGFLCAQVALATTLPARVCTAGKWEPWKSPKWEDLPLDLKTGVCLRY